MDIDGKVVFRCESTTDAKDARVIAETARMRADLTPVTAPDETVVELTRLTAHREDLTADWVRGVNRPRDLLGSIFPRPEQAWSSAGAVRVGLAQVLRQPGPRHSTAQRPGRELLEFCRDREADVLRFATDTRVWPTNNISERDLRPTRTQQKISGRLTSEGVTQDRLDIRSYIDTARKQGINVMTAIRRAITGNPWRPPIPALA